MPTFWRSSRRSKFTTAIFVGTSRGGLHAMLLAAARPALVRGAVLNDVGPVIELQGLSRVRQYLRYPAAPNSLADAMDYIRKTMSAQFPALSEAEIEAYARASFQKPDGSFGATFDPKLVKPLEALRLDEPLPEFWTFYEALAECPCSPSAAAIPTSSRRKLLLKWPAGTAIARPMWLKDKAIRRC